jgi:4'-phosphopantetheinyl transferase
MYLSMMPLLRRSSSDITVIPVNINTLIRTLPGPPAEFAWAWALERSASASLNVNVLSTLTVEMRTPLREDELILWFGAPGSGGWSDLLSHLSEDERVRASSSRFEADRWAVGAAHAGLRVLLGQILARDPHELRFATATNGKPYLDHHQGSATIQFSISHTRGCVAVAVARCAIGVDVERRRAIPDLLAVARRAFAPEERAAVAARVGCAARITLFYRFWTLGEAFIKATGEGLAQDLTSFAFSDQGKPTLMRVSAAHGPVDRWRFDCGH